MTPTLPSQSTAEAEKASEAELVDIQDTIASLEAVLLVAEKSIMQNLVQNALYEEKVVGIKNELFELHLVRQHQNSNRPNDKAAPQKNGGKHMQPRPTKLPPQMDQYLPAPDLDRRASSCGEE
jgi:hypothetical protein